MTSPVEQVRASVPPACLARRCRREGCLVSLTKVPQPSVLIDMDCNELTISPTSRRCDFMFVSDEEGWVVPLELKRGNLDAGEMVAQLRAGARFAERVVPKGAAVRFLPIAVCGGRVHRTERNKLRSNASRIRFRGQYVYIELLKCGQPLTQALRR